MQSEHQVPIWLFIGGILLTYGVLILGVGLYGLVEPSQVQVSLQESWKDAPWLCLHADIWWGALMTAVGAFYCVRFRPGREPSP